MSRNGKVIVAMSGGVDSSVAACLLKEQGYAPVGVFMWIGRDTAGATATADAAGFAAHAAQVPQAKQGCCSMGDSCDARAVAGKLGIPFYTLNFAGDFDRIIEYFVTEYANARTPNPCVMCNTHVKFGKLLAYADAADAEFVATGHHARVLRADGHAGRLARGCDLNKDQSYALFGIRRANLARCLFPVGEIADKQAVRRIAAGLGLDVHDKPESQEICFVPDNDYKRLVRERRPETQRPGMVIDAAGDVVGQHEGIVNYTIGQRRGLRIAAGKPIYVTQLDATANTVTVGPREALLASGLRATEVNWLTDPPSVNQPTPARVKIRYNHEAVPCTFRRSDNGRVEVRFDEPQPAVTPGQAAVLYDGEVVLCGGWIEEALR